MCPGSPPDAASGPPVIGSGLPSGTEVHRWTLARQLLRDVEPGEPLFGSGHLPTRAPAARAHVAARLEHEVAAL